VKEYEAYGFTLKNRASKHICPVLILFAFLDFVTIYLTGTTIYEEPSSSE
jgi:hypothetical protein